MPWLESLTDRIVLNIFFFCRNQRTLRLIQHYIDMTFPTVANWWGLEKPASQAFFLTRWPPTLRFAVDTSNKAFALGRCMLLPHDSNFTHFATPLLRYSAFQPAPMPLLEDPVLEKECVPIARVRLGWDFSHVDVDVDHPKKPSWRLARSQEHQGKPSLKRFWSHMNSASVSFPAWLI